VTSNKLENMLHLLGWISWKKTLHLSKYTKLRLDGQP